MSISNILEVSTAFGYRSVELHHGDLSRPDFEVDAIAVSAFQGGYEPVPGTLIGALMENCEIDVAALAESPRIDYRQQMGAWLSEKLSGHPFKFIACLEMRGADGSHLPVEEAARNLYGLLMVAQLHDLEVRSVAMPLLGTGNQGIDPAEVLPGLMDMTRKMLHASPILERVVFMAFDPEALARIDSAMNSSLMRTDAEVQALPPGGLPEAVRSELLNTLRRLHGSIFEMKDSAELVTHLIDKLDGGGARWFEIASLGRRLCECLVLDLTEQEQTASLLHSLQGLPDLGFARWFVNYLHTLRIFGNVASHISTSSATRPADVDADDFLSLLFCLNRVAKFWIRHRASSGPGAS